MTGKDELYRNMHIMTPTMALPSGTAHQTDIVRSVQRRLRNLKSYIAAYRQYRSECDELLQLDERMLRDMGISRADAERHASMSFTAFRARRM
jgi:uncharacterized protein YjiS (DUF1127 family)